MPGKMARSAPDHRSGCPMRWWPSSPRGCLAERSEERDIHASLGVIRGIPPKLNRFPIGRSCQNGADFTEGPSSKVRFAIYGEVLMQMPSGTLSKFVRSFCFAFTVSYSILLPNALKAQLIDPNNQCYYPPGSTVCQPLPTPAPLPPPSRPVVNQCENQCSIGQQECMRTCTAQHDWYRCFAYCGEGHTVCMRGCPM